MEKKSRVAKLWVPLLVIGVVCVLSLTSAGGLLDPSSSPAPTMHTLGEVYDKIQRLVPENWSTMPSHQQIAGSYSIHMTVQGQDQGLIQGSCEAQGKEDTIAVVGNEYGVYYPTDSQGQITGQRVHDRYKILKYTDKATVGLYQAMVTGERLNSVVIKFYRLGPLGQEEQYYTVRLENAYITEIKTVTPNIESVAFNFAKIRWTWEPDGIEWQDDVYQPK
jgi:type VI secretion system secreted protein Hcp